MTTPAPSPALAPAPAPARVLASVLAPALAAEWLKLRTLRSTWWTLVATFVVNVAAGLLYGSAIRANAADYRREDFDPVLMGFAGVSLGQLAVVCLGVMAVAGEHTTGLVRSSLTAVPNRTAYWTAKVAVLGAATLAVALPTAFATFFVAQTAMGGELNASLGDPGALRAVFGFALHLTLLCLVSAGVAAVLRSTIASLAVLVPLFFVIGDVLGTLPGIAEAGRFLPHLAGSRLMATVPFDRIGYGPLTGLAVFLAWTAVAVAAGLVALRRRDA
ncbi:ABC transporter permease [Streptomyces sp. NPDC047315]|uniref:ABC transporter permease n=1 Tax=Streptomyces sp. NPDC047315 TaxID=3155142 RepID=UPI0033CBF3E9